MEQQSIKNFKMANTDRERDLVLAPNEYAYISDQTKGHIVAYVGPYKTSMANTDQPVYFDEKAKQFKKCGLEESIKTFVTVPEGWYVTLKNPPRDNKQPVIGTANNLPNLAIGRKINIPGPDFFALWPGQMVKVLKGHRLRTNQYLIVRVYEEEQAKKNWNNAVIMPQSVKVEKKETDIDTSDVKEVVPDTQIPNLPVGKLLVIKGTSVSFYIPPTGIEVVPDEQQNYVRQAITLERLEYCILLDENGNKRYVKGPAVVIPEPTETFFMRNNHKKFKAIELSETSGIYVKVISPYTENDTEYNIGDELFISGKEQMIYFPRLEHALIKDGDQEIYHAVAIPPGEGRYFLNRKTGQITLQNGPCMFLPDPREAVIVQRILTKKQCELWYPGNGEVIEFNSQLRQVATREKGQPNEYVPAAKIQQHFKGNIREDKKEILAEIASDEFVRSQTYTTARTITLNTRFEGAVTIDVWTGYAVLVTGRTGNRKVIVGPRTYQLEYDEVLAVMELSTGKPKTDESVIKTVYLRVLHNKVSDIVKVETKDLCPAQITLSYRVNFKGEPEKWFNVENYVKFLTDHLRSKIRNAVQKISITDFYSNGIDILRDVILGKIREDGTRQGGFFEENGMQIYDVEILNIELLDEEIEHLLFTAQQDAVKQKLEINALQNSYGFTKQSEEISRNISVEKSVTKQKQIELQQIETERTLLLALSRLDSEIKTKQRGLEAKLEEQDKLTKIDESEIAREKAKKDMLMEVAQREMEREISFLKADVEAVVSKAQAMSPDLIAALQAFSERALAERVAQSMAPLSILGGQSVADVFSKMLKGTVLEKVLAPLNGNTEDIE